jgi:hypothetical protein
MSMKLKAEELANARQSRSVVAEWTGDMEWAYAAAIREVAQPIADERDEYREALKQSKAMMMEAASLLGKVGGWDAGHAQGTLRQGVCEIDAILAKYPKP